MLTIIGLPLRCMKALASKNFLPENLTTMRGKMRIVCSFFVLLLFNTGAFAGPKKFDFECSVLAAKLKKTKKLVNKTFFCSGRVVKVYGQNAVYPAAVQRYASLLERKQRKFMVEVKIGRRLHAYVFTSELEVIEVLAPGNKIDFIAQLAARPQKRAGRHHLVFINHEVALKL